MSRHKREEVTENGVFFVTDIHNLIFPPDIIRTIPSKGDAMGGTEQHEGEKRQDSKKVLVGKISICALHAYNLQLQVRHKALQRFFFVISRCSMSPS
jgi:hypothetical protein